MSEKPVPPKAKKKPRQLQYHERTFEDPYYWLRERENDEVLEYLRKENTYSDAVMADTKELQEELFEELKGRIKETDVSAPVLVDDYYYYTRTEEGKAYPIYCRKYGSLENEETVILDQNELAKEFEHCALGVFDVSPDHNLLAYSIDTDGSERYTIRIKDLQTGELYTDSVENTHYSFEWLNDSTRFLYATVDDSWRPHKVFCHELGTDPKNDIELYHEPDERFFVTLSKSKSERYIFIEMESKVTTEVYWIDADSASIEPRLFQAREQEHEYYVEHHEEHFYILSNENATNFKLMRTPTTATGRADWEEMIAHRDEVMLESMELFKDHLVLYERNGGLIQVRIRDLATGDEHSIPFEEEVYSVHGAGNPVYDRTVLRLAYSSLVSPQQIIDYDMVTGERTVVKEQEVLGGYDKTQYVCERVYAAAADGTKIPVSLAYKKGTPKDGSAPCWLYGYGSYGAVQDPSFNSNRVSLLDRGFVFAVAHVRGGGEGGRVWYENGKYLTKKNTFADFITCAEYLLDEKYTSSEQLLVCGRSAGGLLIGAILNMRPELFAGAITSVPFVDVINTMMDPTIPLTVMEYEEWGNPNKKDYFEYMYSYSPYDNLTAQAYPHILVRAGLNDPRVQYWEPAKWVAKLREMKADDNLLLLKTDMGRGHMGASGRYDYLKEIAFEYAFALKVLRREDGKE